MQATLGCQRMHNDRRLEITDSVNTESRQRWEDIPGKRVKIRLPFAHHGGIG